MPKQKMKNIMSFMRTTDHAPLKGPGSHFIVSLNSANRQTILSDQSC